MSTPQHRVGLQCPGSPVPVEFTARADTETLVRAIGEGAGLMVDVDGFSVVEGAPVAPVRLDFELYRGTGGTLDRLPVAECSCYLSPSPAGDPREGRLLAVTGCPADLWELRGRAEDATGSVFTLRARVVLRGVFESAGTGLRVEVGPAAG